MVFVVGDGDDDVAVEASLVLYEASGGAHVLTAATVQEPGVPPGGFGVSDCSVCRVDLKSLRARRREFLFVWCMLKSALEDLLEWKRLVGLLHGKREGGCS
ncbi:hypothetical protein CLOM_g12681 [Closterium sp. NIES-68]|nr:hypothetical protein CLOM_g12681 [Closterium sp. NIES-68]